MADISIHIFVQNLRDLMKSEHPNIAGEKDQLESLYKDVFLMSCFLKKIEEKVSFDDEKVNNLVTGIRELVLEAENIVDHFMVDELYLDLRSLHKQIEKVKIEVDQMNAAFDQSTTLVEDVGKKIQKIKSRERSGVQFESLEILALVRCWALESIPFDLALSPSLHTIEVTKCKTSLEMIAKEIAAEHERQCGNRDLQVFIKSP